MTQEKQNKKEFHSIVRVMQTDIPGNKRVLPGLTYIKGVSWSVANGVCRLLKLNEKEKIGNLKDEEIKKITDFIENNYNQLPGFLLNRRKDFETGEDSHLIGNKLGMKQDFDIRRLKKIRSYRGKRHAFGHPVRGQRTKGNFRSGKNKKSVGVKRK